MTKEEIIIQLKSEFPTLTKTLNGEDMPMSPEEYEIMIEQWAELKIQEEAKKLNAAENAKIRQALLDRLNITEEEAKLLLGNTL